MANSPSKIDFTDSLATFLSAAIDDGTWADVLNTTKIDDPGNEAAATQIYLACGELWSNVADDYIQATYMSFYRSTKLWQFADATARDAVGSTEQLAVDDVCILQSDNMFYYVVSVDGVSSSTWAVVPAGATPSLQAVCTVGFTTTTNMTLDSSAAVFTVGDGTGDPTIKLLKDETGTANIEMWSNTKLRAKTRLTSLEEYQVILYDTDGSTITSQTLIQGNGDLNLWNDLIFSNTAPIITMGPNAPEIHMIRGSSDPCGVTFYTSVGHERQSIRLDASDDLIFQTYDAADAPAFATTLENLTGVWSFPAEIGVAGGVPSAAVAGADELVIGQHTDAADIGMTIKCDTTHKGTLGFSDSNVGTLQASFDYDHSTSEMTWVTSTSPVMRIKSSQMRVEPGMAIAGGDTTDAAAASNDFVIGDGAGSDVGIMQRIVAGGDGHYLASATAGGLGSGLKISAASDLHFLSANDVKFLFGSGATQALRPASGEAIDLGSTSTPWRRGFFDHTVVGVDTVGDASASADDAEFITIVRGAGTNTLTFPAAVIGSKYFVEVTGSGVGLVNLASTGGDTFNGAASPLALENGWHLAIAETTVDWRVGSFASGAGSGASLVIQQTFDTGTADADPGNKKFRFDNATQASATFIYANDASSNGSDISAVLQALRTGDRVYIQDAEDSTRYHWVTVTGDPTNASGYTKIPITVDDSGADLRNNKTCGQILLFSGAASGVPAQLVYIVTGSTGKGSDLAVANDQAFRLRPSSAFTVTEIFGEVITAPVGADLIVVIQNDTQTNTVATLTITAGTTTATQTSITNGALAKDDELTIDITQVGSSTTGQDLTVHVRGTVSGS